MTGLPVVEFSQSGEALGRWWSTESDGRILCRLCPRACKLKPGDRGFCFVRLNRDGRMVLDTYGRSTGFCIDPIEKKPLNHFLPGTSVLSFGTAGCNLGCKFCQNWDISKSREVARLSESAGPDAIAAAAHSHGCRSVAFTYNDPVIWAEYAIDVAAECRRQGIKSVAVTAGYLTAESRGEFFAAMDAANIDLKGFSEEFYYRTTGAHLQPVLDSIRHACRETDCWVELTNLVIPAANDGDDELRRMCDWILDAVGSDVPVHFTAFHPDFRMTDRPRTSHETLIGAYETARSAGLRYVYVGNVHDVVRQSTHCPSCRQLLIERDWYQLGEYRLQQDRCGACGVKIAGVFESEPGSWGPRRQPVRIKNSAPRLHSPALPSATAPERSQMDPSHTAAPLEFDRDEQLRIHRAACQVVFDTVCENASGDVEEILGDLGSRLIAGIYVTLKRGQTLRGCCGLQGPPVSLASALVEAARRTAREDPRMPPVAAIELPHLHVSVSILGPPRPIPGRGEDRLGAIEIGRHGLRIAMDGRAGLLLPAVARERDWTARQFLDAVCQKAGLPAASWLSDQATVQIFDGVDFGFPLSDRLDVTVGSEPHVYQVQHFDSLKRWILGNLAALRSGATPLFYCADAPDGLVSAVALKIEPSGGAQPIGLLQYRLRDGIPIQATLYQMTQSVAQRLAGQAASDVRVTIGLMRNLVHHGFAADRDVSGVDFSDRGLLLTDGGRAAAVYDGGGTADDVFKRAYESERFRFDSTQVYSAVCDCSDRSIDVSTSPQREATVRARPPAVAGAFYPASDSKREQLVDELLAGLPPVEPVAVAAAMVPHAGLRYSGRIAADVWRRIELPSDVLIIGPKHTSAGVDWAVAPHDRWQLSATASLPGAIELAEQLAANVPGMELDAAAHRGEHGIEVQLPLLYRLAPRTRVAAVAMHGGSYEELEPAAASLAEWLAGLENPPLLVISSDMNHFAEEQENRRRDAIALERMRENDVRGLLEACRRENISMCGQLPAALVLMTLRALGREINYREVGYGTSADVSGDSSRVVGYAGVLF